MSTKSIACISLAATSTAIVLALFASHAFATSASADVVPIATFSVGSTTTVYHSNIFKFSLAYPSNFTEAEYDEGEGSETIVIQNDTKPIGFQMFITPDDEPFISATSLADDFPTLQITHPKNVTVGTGTPALAFASNAPDLGPSRELWFLHNGYLFEVTTYPNQASLLARIFTTLRFQ